MPSTEQRIPDLLGGVSQLPPRLRKLNEVERMKNALPVPGRGLLKRPGSAFVSNLNEGSESSTAAVFPFQVSGRRFGVVALSGELKVFDLDTKKSIPVTVVGDADEYLEVLPDVFALGTDTFTGSNGDELDGHESDSGDTWTRVSGTGTSNFSIQGNLLLQPSTSYGHQTWAFGDVLPVADYTLSVRAKVPGGGIVPWGFVLRMNPATGAHYRVEFPSAGFSGGHPFQWRIVKCSDYTTVASEMDSDTIDLDFTAYHDYAATVSGNEISLYIDGVLIATVVDGSSPYTSPGKVGLYSFGGSTFDSQWRLDNWSVSYEEQGSPSGNTVFRAVAHEDRLILANTRKIVKRGSSRAALLTPQALIYITQADFGTRYQVTLDGQGINFLTPVGLDANDRPNIGTDTIAQELLTLLQSSTSGYTFIRYGSMIHVQKTNGSDFSIGTDDGLADNALKVIKDKVQRVADLPEKCLGGFILEVSGDPESDRDNYWVKFNEDGTPDLSGVWEETIRPGEADSLDPDTMPHELIFSDRISDVMYHVARPPAPVIALDGDTLDDEKWGTAQNNTGELPDGQQITLTDDGDEAFVDFEDTNGGPIKVLIDYGVRTIYLEDDNAITLTFEINDGPTSTDWTVVKTITHLPGQITLPDALRLEIDIPTAVGENWDMRVTLSYANTPTAGHKAFVYLPSKRPNGKGVNYINYTGRTISWAPTKKYPAGSSWTFVVNGNNVTYTLTGDMTGADIATAVKTSIDAVSGISATNPRAGVVRVTVDAGGVPTITFTDAFSPSTTFWNPDVDLSKLGTITGLTLRNLTDGSSGTISAATTHTATATLTGGVLNTFTEGDEIVVEGSDASFIFREIDWEKRKAGSSLTNPWPSFVDQPLTDVFFHRGRLGFLSERTVVLSEAGKYNNLFRRYTAVAVDSEVIDAKPSGSKPSFHACTSWDEQVLLWGDKAQYLLTGEPVLTPLTVALPLVTSFRSSRIQPAPAGRFVFFANTRGDYSQANLFGVFGQEAKPDAANLCEAVPTYLPGAPVRVVADADLGMMLLQTDDDLKRLVVLRYTFGEGGLQSWGEWTFSVPVKAFALDGTDCIIVTRDGDGLRLETMDLNELDAALLDRRTVLTGVYSSPTTTFTLPYTLATDGSEGTVVVVVNSVEHVAARPTSTTATLAIDASGSRTVGIRYDLRVRLSTLQLRLADHRGRPEGDERGRTQVQRIRFFHEATEEYQVEVARTDRALSTTEFSSLTAEDGDLHVPVLSKNDQCIIELVNDTPFPCRITGALWEGYFGARSRLR